MERVSPTVARFRVDELSPGLLDLPELSAAGIRLEVVAPADVPGVGLNAGASAYATSLSTDPADVVLALHADVRHLDVELAGAGSGGHTVVGDESWWYWTGAGAGHLEVRIPSTLVARYRAGADTPPPPPAPPPDWDAVSARLDRFAGVARESAVERLRDALEARRRVWPFDPPNPRRDRVAQLDPLWGPAAVGDALAAVEAAGLGRGVPPFVPAVRVLALRGVGYQELPLGTSHLHGVPHVPAGFEWPAWDRPGYDPGPLDEAFWPWQSPPGPGPLTFVAQVDLAEAPFPEPWPGPRRGWLLVFVDFDRLVETKPDRARYTPGGHRVVYVAPGTELHGELPPWQDPVYGHAGWESPDPAQGVRYIGYGYPAWLTFEPVDVLTAVPLDRAYVHADHPLPDDLREWLADAVRRASRRDRHWLGGEPNPCQEDPLFEGLRHGLGFDDPAGVEEERGAWVQLLQLASDDATGTMWGDGGLLHFFVRAGDLVEGRFDRTLLTYQSS